MKPFSQLPPSDSHRLVPVSSAEVQAGVAPGTWAVVVSGSAPCLNMRVTLEPAVYIRQPEYWRIEVVGTVPGGFCLTAMKEYTEVLPLSGAIGTRGVEIVGEDFELELDIPPVELGELRRIYQVGEVSLAMTKRQPPSLLISARGTVSTSGWGDPRLVPLSDGLADDGYAEFEFVADPPDGPALQVLSPIKASLSWSEYPAHAEQMRGVRVLSATVEVTAELPGEAPPGPSWQDVARLGKGEAVTVDGGALELELTAVEDSRCPANAICVWQGLVEVTVRARARGGKWESLRLSSEDAGPTALGDSYYLRLLDVVPYPGVSDPDEPPVAHILVMRM